MPNNELHTVEPVPHTAFRPSFPNPAVWTDELIATRQREYAAFMKTPEGIAEDRAFNESYSEWESRREAGQLPRLHRFRR